MPAGAAAPFFWGALASGVGALGGAALSSHSASNAARRQTESANYAAELEAKAAQDALAFAREQEATRQREWEQAQARNYELWLQQRRDLAPYRNLGAGSIAQLALPIPKSATDRPNAGTIAALINGR